MQLRAPTAANKNSHLQLPRGGELISQSHEGARDHGREKLLILTKTELHVPSLFFFFCLISLDVIRIRNYTFLS